MTDREKVVADLEKCLDDSVAAVVPADTVRDAIALLKRSFTPDEVYDTVIEHGYHDERFKLGDKIDYSFTDVVDILNIELMCKKVIKVLEMSYRDSNVDEDNTLVPQQLVLDAIALLKAQEPRVMTVEEVVGCVILERNITLWFEFSNGIMAINTKDIVYNDFLCDVDFPTLAEPNLKWVDGGKRDGVIIAEYNYTFRCWTARPTEEQREATPWN